MWPSPHHLRGRRTAQRRASRRIHRSIACARVGMSSWLLPLLLHKLPESPNRSMPRNLTVNHLLHELGGQRVLAGDVLDLDIRDFAGARHVCPLSPLTERRQPFSLRRLHPPFVGSELKPYHLAPSGMHSGEIREPGIGHAAGIWDVADPPSLPRRTLHDSSLPLRFGHAVGEINGFHATR